MATDPFLASVVLLLSCDGANGSTTFTDQSPAAHGVAGRGGATNDAQVQTSLKKWGTGSLRLDGDVDNINYVDSADWNFGSGNFTLDQWVAFDNLGGFLANENCVISQWEASGNQRSWLYRFSGNATPDVLEFLGSSDGAATDLTVSGTWTPNADQFYLLSFDRSGNTFRSYIDGVMLAKVTQAFTFKDSSGPLRIGARSNAGPAGNMRGNVDDIRITKGVARYASDSGFSLPDAAWPRI